MGRLYMVPFENVAVAAAQDFFEISPADDKPVAIHGWTLSNVGGTADAGDAQEEFLRLSIVRGHTTSGSGGTTPTISPAVFNDAAAGFAAEANNTTIASTSGTTIWADGMNIRIGHSYFFTPETRPTASQANTTIVLRLVAAPADSVNMSGTLYVEELI